MYRKFWIILAAVCIVLPLSAFGKDKDKDQGKFTLPSSAEIGSTQLAPGDYTAEWTGSGHNVDLNILKDKQVVAKTQAQLKQMPAADAQNAVGVNSTTHQLEEIQLGKSRADLVLQPAQH